MRAHGQRYAASCPNTVLSPGNSSFRSIYSTPPNSSTAGTYLSAIGRFARGIVFEATPGAILNEMRVERGQRNNFYNADEITQTCTPTAVGSANLTVDDGTKLPVGMPVVFSATANGFTVDRLYFVHSVSGNTITLGAAKSDADILATGTTAMTIKLRRMTAFEVVGIGTGRVSNSSFLQMDLEGGGGCMALLENCSQIRLEVGQMPGDKIYAHIVARNAQYCSVRADVATITDYDANSAGIRHDGARDKVIQRLGLVIFQDPISAVTRLSFYGASSGNTGTMHIRAPGRAFIYPDLAMGQRLSASTQTALTLGAGNAGVAVYNGSTDAVYTLPTIPADTPATPIGSYVGCSWEVTNAATFAGAILTVNTDGTQTIGGVAGKTNIKIPVGGTALLRAAKRSDGTLFWELLAGPSVDVLSGSIVYDPPSLAAGGVGAAVTITITGVALGDFVSMVSFSLDTQGLEFLARVSAANTVSILPRNPTASAIDLASGTLAVRVRRAV